MTEPQPAPPTSKAPTPKPVIYPLLLVHVLAFGWAIFKLSYQGNQPIEFAFIFGVFSAAVYLVFYVDNFGRDEVKWMFINAGLGLFGLYAQLDLILSFFDRRAADFPLEAHIMPALFYVLYTFLLRQLIIDLCRARHKPARKHRIEQIYVVTSILVYASIWLLV